MRRCVKAELRSQMLEHRSDREIDHLSTDDPGLQLVDVEERIKHARHSTYSIVESTNQRQRGFVLDLFGQ
jgi:hypothetical protein